LLRKPEEEETLGRLGRIMESSVFKEIGLEDWIILLG